MQLPLSWIMLAAGIAAAQPQTLSDLVADVATLFPRGEMRACALEHSQQAADFSAAATRFAARVDAVLADLPSHRDTLAHPVPAEFFVFQSQLAALSDTDFRTRSLQECRARIAEFDALQDDELKDGLSESTKSLSDTLRTYRENMERAMGIEPTS